MINNPKVKDFILTNITLYFFAMGVWSTWSYFAFVGLEKMDWQGSLVYLPHGIRVLGICFFGLKSLPALMAAELTGPLFINPEQYMGVWSLASFFSLASVVVAKELVRYSQSNIRGAIMSPINFANFRLLVLVIVLSGLLNSISVNVVITYLEPSVMLDPIVIGRFFIGDVLGAFVVILFLSVTFTTLRLNRLASPSKE
jgi:hypothetical protein